MIIHRILLEEYISSSTVHFAVFPFYKATQYFAVIVLNATNKAENFAVYVISLTANYWDTNIIVKQKISQFM